MNRAHSTTSWIRSPQHTREVQRCVSVGRGVEGGRTAIVDPETRRRLGPDCIGEVWIGNRIAWQIERHFGPYGEMRPAGAGGDRMFLTSYSDSRQLIAWVLGLGEHARILGPPELVAELLDRVTVLIE